MNLKIKWTGARMAFLRSFSFHTPLETCFGQYADFDKKNWKIVSVSLFGKYFCPSFHKVALKINERGQNGIRPQFCILYPPPKKPSVSVCIIHDSAWIRTLYCNKDILWNFILFINSGTYMSWNKNMKFHTFYKFWNLRHRGTGKNEISYFL